MYITGSALEDPFEPVVWICLICIDLHKIKKTLYVPSLTAALNISASHKQLEMILKEYLDEEDHVARAPECLPFDLEPTIADSGIPPTPHALEMPDRSVFYSPAQSHSVSRTDLSHQ